jgi:hypothetical protein
MSAPSVAAQRAHALCTAVVCATTLWFVVWTRDHPHAVTLTRFVVENRTAYLSAGRDVSVTGLELACNVVTCVAYALVWLQWRCLGIAHETTHMQLWAARVFTQPMDIVAVALAAGMYNDVAVLWLACLQAAIVQLRAVADAYSVTAGVPSMRVAYVAILVLELFACVPIVCVAAIAFAEPWPAQMATCALLGYVLSLLSQMQFAFACVHNRLVTLTHAVIVDTSHRVVSMVMLALLVRGSMTVAATIMALGGYGLMMFLLVQTAHQPERHAPLQPARTDDETDDEEDEEDKQNV